MSSPDYEKWSSQFRKGYLEFCVLTLLDNKESSYGFELIEIFKQAGLNVNEGTLYPLLNRMQKNSWLDSYWETPEQGGHPRRFYTLSKNGSDLLPEMLQTNNDNQEILAALKCQ